MSTSFSRPGYRIARKSRKSAKIGKAHRINKDQAIEFFRTGIRSKGGINAKAKRVSSHWKKKTCTWQGHKMVQKVRFI